MASLFPGMWYLKNYVYSGNPILPYGGDFFPTTDWTGENTQAYLKGISSNDISLRNFVSWPIKLTIAGWKQFWGLAFLGPLLIGLLPLIFMIKKKNKLFSFSLFFSILYYIIIFFTSQQPRLLMPMFPLLCILGAWGWQESILSKRSKKVLSGVLVIVIFLNLPLLAGYHGKGVNSVLGIESDQEYLLRILPETEGFTWMNNNLNSNDRVWLIGTVNGYYLDIPYVWGEKEMQGIVDFEGKTTLEQLSAQEINYLMIKKGNKDHPTIRNWLTSNEDYFETVYETEKVEILKKLS